MIIQELSEFLSQYFEVLQTQDMELFDKIFHESCVLYSKQDDLLIARPFKVYRDIVEYRQSPASLGAPRKEEVLAMDVLSPTMVQVKVRLRLFNNIMEDHLNLMKNEGRWMIYAKHFYRVEEVESAI